MEIRRIDREDYERQLPERGFDVFHTGEALATVDRHTDADLQLFGGYKGQEAVGLLPVFVRSSAVGRLALSPPPGLAVPHMGPILMANSPKRRKIERVNRTFSEGVLDELGVSSRRTLFRFVGSPSYVDPRPFGWADLDVETRFTYVLQVSDDIEALLDQFSRDLRNDIRNSENLDCRIDIEGPTAAARIAEDVADRYREQDKAVPFTVEYVRDLVEALGRRARAYVARDPDGEYLGGLIVLYSDDRASFWQGGVKRDVDGVSLNSILHWRVIRDIAAGEPIPSVDGYDLVGANTERICTYKAKFGADLVPYYAVESSGRGMAVAKRAYQVLKG
jgi:hypothetical protein